MPASLFQIRQGYRASWRDLSLSVESGSQQWTVRVHDARTDLYTAHRSSARAAQAAGMEYAIFRVLGPAAGESPERLAQQVNWNQYW